MNTSTILLACAGVLAVQGCAVDPTVAEESEEVVTNESAVSAGNASVSITSSWNTGYCASVSVTNGLDEATARWRVVLDLKTSTVTSAWNVSLSKRTGVATATPANYNTSISPGSSTSFGFCAKRTSSTVLPVIKAWNMVSSVYATCPTNSGLNPTKAALAVAMARELGRWDPLNDLTVGAGTGWLTTLTSTGLARCSNGCKNVKALLGQQTVGLTSVIDQNIFNPTVLISDLGASFGRHSNLILNLMRNNPAALPPAHKLTMVAGPTNMGKGNCGPHYIFQVDNSNGTPLTTKQAANMANALCFYGHGSCGNNPYIGFIVTTTACPTGRTCIAIDPTDGDNSSTSTTTAGSAPTYPMNRVYNTTNSLLGTQCITTTGLLGTLVSKCSIYPTTCNYLYCVAS